MESKVSIFTYGTLNSLKSAIKRDGVRAYCKETLSEYIYIQNGVAYTANDTSVTTTGIGGTTRWVAISGKYSYWVSRNTTVFTSGPQNLTDVHADVVCNSAGGFTVNMPTATAVLVNKLYNIKNIGAGDITVSAGVNIDDALTLTISQWQSIAVKLIDLGGATYMWIII